MALDLSSLRKAVNSLQHALKIASTQAGTDSEDVIRAGVIKNFEFTYELCWKFIKRWLEKNSPEADLDGLTRKELFRIAAEKHLINDVEPWFKYHAARNETSHTYDSAKAEAIFAAAKLFAADAQALLKELEKRND
jgi:nucleotidyltransferase substrate binding protein (TIGR01987 family)